MSKHDDSPIGARLREWILEKYGSLKKAAEGWGITPAAINPVLKGKAKLGSEWIQRIVEGGGNYQYILTGIKNHADDEFAKHEHKGITAEDVVVKAETAGGNLIIKLYKRKPQPEDEYEDFGRAAATPKQPPSVCDISGEKSLPCPQGQTVFFVLKERAFVIVCPFLSYRRYEAISSYFCGCTSALIYRACRCFPQLRARSVFDYPRFTPFSSKSFSTSDCRK